MQLPGVFFVDLAGDDEDGVLDCEEVLEVHHGLIHLRGLGHLVTEQYRTGVKVFSIQYSMQHRFKDPVIQCTLQ